MSFRRVGIQDLGFRVFGSVSSEHGFEAGTHGPTCGFLNMSYNLSSKYPPEKRYNTPLLQSPI